MTDDVKNRIIHISKKDAVLQISSFLLCVAAITFTLLYRALPLYILIIAYTVEGILLLSVPICYVLNLKKTYRLLFVLTVCLFLFAVIYFVLEKTGFMSIFQVDQSLNGEARKHAISENFKEYLLSKGSGATILFIFMQFLQTTILPIPSFILTGAGTLMYSQAYGDVLGPIINSAYSLIGILIGSYITFWIARKYGVKLVVWIVGKESLKKTLTLLKGRDILLLTLMFLLPFFPDDILCFVAGLSSMSTLYYFVVITVSRILVVFGSSYLINLIPFTTWWGLMIWGIFVAIVIVLFYLSIRYGDKMLDFINRKILKRRKVEKEDEFDKMIRMIDAMGREESAVSEHKERTTVKK